MATTMTKRLAAAIERDDRLEAAGMHADDRVTCWTHQAWADDCAHRHAPLNAMRLLAEAREVDRARWVVARLRERQDGRITMH